MVSPLPLVVTERSKKRYGITSIVHPKKELMQSLGNRVGETILGRRALRQMVYLTYSETLMSWLLGVFHHGTALKSGSTQSVARSAINKIEMLSEQRLHRSRRAYVRACLSCRPDRLGSVLLIASCVRQAPYCRGRVLYRWLSLIPSAIKKNVERRRGENPNSV